MRGARWLLMAASSSSGHRVTVLTDGQQSGRDLEAQPGGSAEPGVRSVDGKLRYSDEWLDEQRLSLLSADVSGTAAEDDAEGDKRRAAMDTAQRKQIQGLYRIDGRRLARAPLDGLAGVRLRTRGEPAIEPLTPRETAVLQLIADGWANREIGQLLSISEETVKSHVRQLLARLHARNRAHAVSVAFRRRLII